MERRMRGNSHVRCGGGEKAAITSKPYLFLLRTGGCRLRLNLIRLQGCFLPGLRHCAAGVHLLLNVIEDLWLHKKSLLFVGAGLYLRIVINSSLLQFLATGLVFYNSSLAIGHFIKTGLALAPSLSKTTLASFR